MASLEVVYGKLKELLTTLGLPINMSKCAIISVNDTTVASGELQNIQKVNNFKYLGEYISKDGSSTESYIQFIKNLSSLREYLKNEYRDRHEPKALSI